jgi:DNA invertase Pin-like site-specific DNA recombinase
MKIGYARVSTEDQNLELQRTALLAAGCEAIHEERASGRTRNRPALKQVLSELCEGDTLVVWKLDRLGRSVAELIQIVQEVEAVGARFESITDSIDTSTSMGRFFFHVMSSLAQMERELIVERTLAGLAVARSHGRVGGRPRVMSESKIRQALKLVDGGEPPREVARTFGVGQATIYRYMKSART